MTRQVRIATRRSRLALWQAEHVAARLAACHPGLVVSLVPIVTEGDRIQDRSLAASGGKGLFIKELENALQDGRADIAVHSMKDMPAALPAGFTIAAALERGDARDAFVSPRYESLAALPAARASALRACAGKCQLRHRRPDLEVVVLRGNVDTRIAKLDAGACDATVLAAAGLERLGLESRIRARLAPSDMLPAIGQGIVGIECLTDARRHRHPRAPARARRDALDARRRARVRGENRRQLPLPDRRLRDARRRDAPARRARRLARRALDNRRLGIGCGGVMQPRSAPSLRIGCWPPAPAELL